MTYRAEVLLSVQRALLGQITPDIRTIVVCWNENEIRLRFVIEGEMDTRLQENIWAIETEVNADFPTANVSSFIERRDGNLPINWDTPSAGELAVAFA
jgi:hypothetical protein